MPTEEAIDLIEALPDGSDYVSSVDFSRSWSPERHRNADVLDAIMHVAWLVGYDHEVMPEPPRVTRPKDAIARAESRRRSARVRAELESGGWEEV